MKDRQNTALKTRAHARITLGYNYSPISYLPANKMPEQVDMRLINIPQHPVTFVLIREVFDLAHAFQEHGTIIQLSHLYQNQRVAYFI